MKVTTDVEKINALFLLHQIGEYECWSEDLLSRYLFGFEHDCVLTNREMFILEEMVRLTNDCGYSSTQSRERISRILKIDKASIDPICSDIKRKLRNGIDSQVQQCIDLKRPRRMFWAGRRKRSFAKRFKYMR